VAVYLSAENRKTTVVSTACIWRLRTGHHELPSHHLPGYRRVHKRSARRVTCM